MKTFFKRIYSGFSKVWGRLSLPWGFAITSVLLARLFYTLWSFVVISLFPVAIQNINLSGKPVLTVFDLRTSQRYIYSRAVGEDVLAFRPVNGNFVRDIQTDSIWELSSGKAVEGPLAGSRLQISTVPVESTHIKVSKQIPPRYSLFGSILMKTGISLLHRMATVNSRMIRILLHSTPC